MPKGSSVNRALQRLRQFDRGNTVQPGMFSTLDEAIKDAPFERNSIEQWRAYLQPGRVVKRDGAQFPLKKEELDWSLNRLTFEEPDYKYTKEQLRELIAGNRQGFGVTMARESNIPETDLFGGSTPIPGSWVEDGRQLGAEVKIDAPRYGSDYAGDTDSRLFHASPGSTYEESVTRMPGLDFANHFDKDALSWARTSTHNTDGGRVRLVEEIQSDLHSAAADKIHVDSTGDFISDVRYRASKNVNPEFNESDWTAQRIGHDTKESKKAAEVAMARLSVLEKRMNSQNPITLSGNVSKKYINTQSEAYRLANEVDVASIRVPDAPYKNPADYAGLELRKQLLNAVDNDENYLALVRGADQVERYSQGMNERSVRGMEQMYDKVYLGELRKLAKRYGAKVEDVEIPVSSAKDARPEVMVHGGHENLGDFMADASSAVYQLNGPQAYASDINMFDTALNDLRILGRQTMDENKLPKLEGLLNELEEAAIRFDELTPEPTTIDIKSYQDTIDPTFNKIQQTLEEAYSIADALEVKNKSFPAIELTPEVKERILKLGVPQFAEGGVVRRPGGLSVFSSLRRPDAEISEDEYEKIFSQMSKSEDERVLQDKMGEGKYWWDTVKHLPAMFLARMKKYNPDTGEVRWLGRAPTPDLDMVAKGLMTMEEWREEKQAAEEYNTAGEDFESTWVDDTKSMAALPALIGNLAGEYGVGPGSLTDPDKAFQVPEFAAEAAGRVGAVERATQEDFGIEDPTGFPQHLMGALGAMGAQVPVPGAQLRGMARGVTSKIPDALKTVASPITKPLGVISEFANPFIDPTVASYGMGTAFGGALGTALEPSGEDVREFEELGRMQREQEEYDDMSSRIDNVFSSEAWEDVPMDIRMDLMNSVYGESTWDRMSSVQQDEMKDEMYRRGVLDDAE